MDSGIFTNHTGYDYGKVILVISMLTGDIYHIGIIIIIIIVSTIIIRVLILIMILRRKFPQLNLCLASFCHVYLINVWNGKNRRDWFQRNCPAFPFSHTWPFLFLSSVYLVFLMFMANGFCFCIFVTMIDLLNTTSCFFFFFCLFFVYLFANITT